MAKIKLSTMGGVPRFNHNGLTVGDSWQEVDTDELSDDSRQALIDYVGRFVRVHDEDQDAFRSLIAPQGYEFKDGQVTDTRSPEEREREKAAAAKQGSSATRDTAAGRPTPPRDDTAGAGTFQGPPPTDDVATSAREREASPTSPDKPSNKPRPR